MQPINLPNAPAAVVVPLLMLTLPIRQDNRPELLLLRILTLGNILTSRFLKAPMKRTQNLRKAIPI
jgi:hypothetical protein